ncbi:MAG: histidine kinase [Bacteroidia bacterium]|nr:histidine kinase [Bacteroidia bacterium]
MSSFLAAQSQRGPSAAFYFNKGSPVDAVTGHRAGISGASFTTDRFGNKDHAIFLSGTGDSHLNLGTYKELKPSEGSISLWVKMEHPIRAGKGVPYNPILITRCADREDFNEAYVLYYMLESGKMLAACCRDSTREIGVYSKERFEREVWKHLVVSYDSSHVALYIDGRLQQSSPKKFKTVFLEGESVLVGFNGSAKNLRWWNGSVDDIEFYDHVLSEEEIINLFHAPNPNKTTILVQRILIALAILVVLVLIYFLIRYRVKQVLKREKQKHELNNVILQTELRVNRALMNPHFVFNSLNALQNLILSQEIEKANDYLVKFSKMIRKLLESNMSDLISLEMEIELLKRYMEIENLRFEENIAFNIEVDPAINTMTTRIPVMMLQPFVENAIWHGLLKKQGEKLLTIYFSLVEDKYILCVIEDNGIGKENKKNSAIFDKASLATSFIEQRLQTLNRIHGLHCEMSIEYKTGQSGTKMKILLPILKA